MNFKRALMLLLAGVMLMSVALGAMACDQSGAEQPTTDVTTEQPSGAPTTEEQTTETPTDDGKVTYTVTVVDASGAPVAGVAVQFCDDNGCRMPVATNAEGIVTLTDAESNFHVTLASVPAGFAADATEYYFDGAYELTVTLVSE